MSRLGRYLNPISRLGHRKYSVVFPFGFTLFVAATSEFIISNLLRNPNLVGAYGIILFLILIIYFAFRDGIRGGLTATLATLSYYSYIILTRPTTPEEKFNQWETTLMLATAYVTLSIIIGWLKQTVDYLIEREANERRRLQAIMQQLPVGVVVTDSKGKVVLGNKYMNTILGREMARDVVVGRDNHPKATHNGKPVSPTQWPLAQTLATGKSVNGKEYIIQREDGRDVYLNISASLIHNQRGEVIAAATILHDITQLKELEKRKDDFVNIASHELKTPITSMKLYLELLSRQLKQSGDKEAQKTLKSIRYQSDRLQELVSDLLDVSRLQTGKLAFSKQTFKLNDLVIETVDQLKGAAKNQNLIIKNSTPMMVNADRFRIYQVLTNLITNAIKYSGPNTDIIIKLKKEADKAVVCVQDHGIGIDKAHLRKVFDRLYQVSDSKEQTFPGFGMGLYISKEIVKRHQGQIWVESEKGKGSTFYFSLPLEK